MAFHGEHNHGIGRPFQKGHTISNVNWIGKHHSEEAKRKMSEAHRGKTMSIEQRKKISNSLTGKSRSEETKIKISLGNKGKHRSEETRKKISLAKKGKSPWIKGRTHSIDSKIKMSESHKNLVLSEGHIKSIILNLPRLTGDKHPQWRGGKRLNKARSGAKRKKRGFILLTKVNPYNEPIEYHHIHPNLPYVVPCPKRIHQMFNGRTSTHFDNVNAMIGIKIGESYDIRYC